MKLFTARTASPVPGAWRHVLWTGEDDGPAHVAVVADNRLHVMRLMEQAAVPAPMIINLTGALRLNHGQAPAPVTLLLAARVLDLATPAVYAWEHFADGHRVIRVTGPSREVAAYWRRPHLAGQVTAAEPVQCRDQRNTDDGVRQEDR